MLGSVNWLDIVVLVYVALGAWTGLRMGLALTIASLASYAVALWIAARWSDPVLAWASGRWHLAPSLARWLHGLVQPAGATLTALYRTQMGPAASASAANFTNAAANLILHYAAFAVLFLAAHAVIWLFVRTVAARAPRRGPAGLANRVLGLCAGAAEHALIAAVVLGFVVSLGAIAALAPVSHALADSRFTPYLLGAFRAWEPAAAHWWLAV